MGDREAVKESGLSELVEKLPGLLYCIGDCVYTPTEHLIPIYSADNTIQQKLNMTITIFMQVNFKSA